MRRITMGVALLAATALLLPQDMAAQRGRHGPGMHDGPGAMGVEGILRLRERLELTDDQVARLDALRAEAVQRRTEHQAQMAELRSRLAAGQIERSEIENVMRTRREGSAAVREQMLERLDGILTDTQREELDQLRRERRAFLRGRASARRGGPGMMRGGGRPGMRGGRPGMRGGRGFDRGWGFRRGPGFDAGFGPGFDRPFGLRGDRGG